VELTGKWEFYWQQFLTNEDFQKNIKNNLTGYLSVPGLWNNFEVKFEKIRRIMQDESAYEL
jgi:hypothetical protein